MVGAEGEEVTGGGGDAEGGFAEFCNIYNLRARDREVEDLHALPDGRAGRAGPENVDAGIGHDEGRVVDGERGRDSFVAGDEVFGRDAGEGGLVGAVGAELARIAGAGSENASVLSQRYQVRGAG